MKSKYPDNIIKEMSERLDSVRKTLELSKSQFATALGYSNQSPLTQLGKSNKFIGPDKLMKVALLKSKQGGSPNVNWILTGLGPELLELEQETTAQKKAAILADLLDPATIEQLIQALGQADPQPKR